MSESQCFGAHRQTVGAPEWARARSHVDDGAACVCDGFFRFPFSHMYVGTTRPAAHTVHVAPSEVAVFQFPRADSDTEVERLNSRK